MEQNQYSEKISARKLWQQILVAQIETGTPYMLYKDSINIKSNQKNIGTIDSNLCTEIVEYSDDKEYACCTLASISLPSFVRVNQRTNKSYFDYEKLHSVTQVVTANLNRIVDVNLYHLMKQKHLINYIGHLVWEFKD